MVRVIRGYVKAFIKRSSFGSAQSHISRVCNQRPNFECEKTCFSSEILNFWEVSSQKQAFRQVFPARSLNYLDEETGLMLVISFQ